LEQDEYYYEVWESMPIDIVSNDYRIRNKNLITEMTYDLYRINDMMGSMPPKLARAVLASFFGKVMELGIR